MNKKKLFKDDRKYIMNTYRRYPLLITRGKGKYVWDEKGRKYLDFFSGLSVSNLGHCPEVVVKAVKEQAGRFMHTSNLYYTEPQVKLAEHILSVSMKGKVFFSNSGAEANECAVKLARKWGRAKKAGAHDIIVFKNSFHGRTIGTLSATGQEKYKKEFVPLLAGFRQAVFNDLASVRKLINRKTCAVLIEPVQGEGGINIAGREFLAGLYKLCRKNKALLIVDEVQSGMGRTGRMFAYQHYPVKPDIITLAKAAGGGLPLGVTVAAGSVAGVLSYGDHGSTFGGNPVCVSAGLAVIRLLNKKLLDKVKNTGGYFVKKLEGLKAKHPEIIREVRGIGLMVAMELNVSRKIIKGKDLVLKCLDKGVLMNCTQDKVIRFMPSLIVDKKDVDTVIKALAEALNGKK